MSELVMTEDMKKSLDSFFASKTINDVDRSAYLICNLNDRRINITVSIVFMRDWDSIEPDSYNDVIIENKGAVFTFPCYWISVPKELTMTYFEYIINNFYETEVCKWDVSKKLANTTTNENNNCPCNTTPAVSQPPCAYVAQNI